MGDSIKAAAEEAEQREWLEEIARFSRRSPIDLLTMLKRVDEELRRLKFDEMRLTAVERDAFSSVQRLIRSVLS